MVIVLFRLRLTPETGDDYSVMAAETDRLARSSPGYVDVKSFKAEDGERLPVVWWQDEKTLKGWT